METPREPKYTGLPRRYEETKPALDQVFSHTNILRIGERILEKFEETSESRKQSALEDCKNHVWIEAEEYKNNCVKEALEHAANEEALRVKEREKQHARNIENEISRVRELMRQQCVEERYEERKDGESQMQEMAERMHKHHELEKMAEVKAARIEEQGIAENTLQEMMRRHENAMRIFGEEMEEGKKSELAVLRFDLEDYRLDTVKKAREEEQEDAEKRMITMKTVHQKEIDSLTEEIQRLNSEKAQLESDLSSMTTNRDVYVEKYKKLRNEFTGFIEGCRQDFSSEQADFLLPPNSKLD